jgi:putative intracellular protease/amidase
MNNTGGNSMESFKHILVISRMIPYKILRDLFADDYDALFYPGGLGPLWNLADDRCSIALIDAMYAQGKPVSAVCHAPGVLHHVKAPARWQLDYRSEYCFIRSSGKSGFGAVVNVRRG